MKKLLLALLLIVSASLNAQDFNMQTNVSNLDCTTGGNLFDSGGNASAYADNESFIYTICPGSAGFGVFATMNIMTISAGDGVSIFDGDDNTAPVFPDMPLNISTTYGINAQFQASVTNVTGCLTFEFTSDGDGATGDFEFALTCEAKCQNFHSSITNTIPDTTFTPESIYLDLCLGDTFHVEGANTYPMNNTDYVQSDATSTFEWYWETGSTIAELGQIQDHYFGTPGGYVVKMISYDINGCRNIQDQIIKIRVAPLPVFTSLTDSILCYGDSMVLVGLPEGTIVDGQVIQGDTVYFIPPFLSGDSTFLPDGNGAVYTSPAQISGFDNNAIIQDCGSILDICITMEHSYIGDLNIEIVCPNGQSSTLKSFPGGGGTFLGNPWDPGTIPGGGLEYCFSTTSPNGFLVNGPTQPATNSPGNTVIPDVYEPETPFTNLVGCPINGNWELRIQDNLTVDDGYIFNWTLEVANCMQPDVDSFIMVYDFGYWDPELSIISTNADSNEITIFPDHQGLLDYTYHTSDQFGCDYSEVYTVFVDSFGVDASPTDTTVCVGEPVQINTVATGPVAGFTYAWAPGTDLNNGNIANPISTLSSVPIEYTVGVTNSNSCTYYDTINIHTQQDFAFSAVGDTFICAGDSIQLFTFGGATSTAWTSNLNNNSINDTTLANPFVYPTTTTTYTVQADSTGCSQYANIQVAVSNITAFTLPPVDAACGLANGSLVYIGNGGIGVLNYSSDGGTTWQNTGFFSNLNGGTYHIVISDGSGCDYLDTAFIGGGAPLVIDTVIIENPTCGDPNGSLQAILTDPSLAVTYTLDVGAVSQDTSLFNGLNSGVFNITIDDGVCPAIDTTITLTNSSTLALSVDSSHNVLCYDQNNGEIFLSGSGGVLPYSFSIDSGNTSFLSTNFNHLDSGIYDVILEDDLGCTVYQQVIIIEPDSMVITNISVVDALCNADFVNLSFDATGGTSPYEYSIDGGTTYGGLNNYLLQAGNFALQVRDFNNCASEIHLDTVFEPAVLFLSVDSTINTICNESNGAIYLNCVGGSTPYSFTVNGGSPQDTLNFLDLSANTYLVEVTDNNGCSDTLFAIVQDDATVSLSIMSFDSVSCNGLLDATVLLDPSSGLMPYSFNVDGDAEQSDSLFTNLSGGYHIFNITDANGCTEQVSLVIYEPSLLVLSHTETEASCYGFGDAEIILSSVGGELPYSFALNDYSITQLSGTFSSLTAGNHVGFIIDDNGCSDTTTILVSQPDTLIISNIVAQDISCNGDADGSFIVAATGGTEPYSYSIDIDPFQASNTFNGLNGGIYTLNVTDINNCPLNSHLDSIFEPTALVFVIDSFRNISCFNSNDGYISAVVTGGTSPYTYSNDNGVTYQSMNTFSNLAEGTYNVWIKDDNDCTLNQTISLTQPTEIIVTTSTVSITCAGSLDGIINIDNIVGGVGPYLVSLDGAIPVNALSFGSLLAGNHTIEIIDATNCHSNIMVVNIYEPAILELSLNNLSDVTCFGDADGSINLSATNGTPQYIFTLNNNGVLINSNSGNTATYNNLDGGQYPTYLTDINGCTDTLMVSIDEPSEIVIDSLSILSEISCFDENDAAINVYASGGSIYTYPAAPYTYLWSPSGTTNNKDSELGPGIHTVTVTDANGCSVSASDTIAPVAPILATIIPDSAFISMGEELQLGVNVINALSNNLQYEWFPEDGLSCTDCENPIVTIYNSINYSVLVTDSNGCTNYNETDVFIGIDPSLFFFIPNGFSPNGDGVNDIFEIYGQDVKTVELMVFNRWGEKIFEGNNQFQTWDGTYNGVVQPPSIYTYAADITFLNDVVINKKGSVTLFK